MQQFVINVETDPHEQSLSGCYTVGASMISANSLRNKNGVFCELSLGGRLYSVKNKTGFRLTKIRQIMYNIDNFYSSDVS